MGLTRTDLEGIASNELDTGADRWRRNYMMKRGRQAIARLLTLLMVLPAGAAPSAMTTPHASANVLWRPLPLPLDAVLRGRTAPRVEYIPTTASQSASNPIVSRLQQRRFEATPVGAIVAENSLAGSPHSEWDLDPINGLGGLGGSGSSGGAGGSGGSGGSNPSPAQFEKYSKCLQNASPSDTAAIQKCAQLLK